MAGRQEQTLELEVIGNHDFSKKPLELRCMATEYNKGPQKVTKKCKRLLAKLTSGVKVDIEMACPVCRTLNRFRIT